MPLRDRRGRPGRTPAWIWLILFFTCACSTQPWRAVPAPWAPGDLELEEEARLTLREGAELVLINPRLTSEQALVNLHGTDSNGERRSFSTSEVRRIETRRVEPGRALFLDSLVVTGLIGLLVVVIVVWPPILTVGA